MVHQFLRAGNTAVITGAGAGGIGFSVALHCAKLGLRLVLADNDEHALASATKELATSGFNPESLLTVKTDVSDYSAMEKLANDARAFGNGRIDFLMLNAGVQAPTKDFDANGRAQLSAWTKTLDVNLFGVLNGTQAFVDGMKAQGTPAGIVITGSKQGITAPPGNPAYNVSKAAVKALAESLSYSLRDTSVSVNLLVPGYTFTKLTAGGSIEQKAKPAPAWTCDQVAEELFKRMDNEFYIICPDNDVTEKLDMARMAWTAGDLLQKRAPLSRWRPEYKDEFEKHIRDY